MVQSLVRSLEWQEIQTRLWGAIHDGWCYQITQIDEPPSKHEAAGGAVVPEAVWVLRVADQSATAFTTQTYRCASDAQCAAEQIRRVLQMVDGVGGVGVGGVGGSESGAIMPVAFCPYGEMRHTACGWQHTCNKGIEIVHQATTDRETP